MEWLLKMFRECEHVWKFAGGNLVRDKVYMSLYVCEKCSTEAQDKPWPKLSKDHDFYGASRTHKNRTIVKLSEFEKSILFWPVKRTATNNTDGMRT